MKIVPPSFKILSLPARDSILQLIEGIGRICYKSEDQMTQASAKDFVRRLLRAGHHSVIEHLGITVHFICDRGISHELVRHRLASYSQESTRYANYSKEKFGREITLIRPFFWAEGTPPYTTWIEAMKQAERNYLLLIKLGASPQQARGVLPTSLKTEIVMSCNLREWRHVFDLRCSKASHPQMRELMLPLLDEFRKKIPVLFDDLYEKYQQEIAQWPTPTR